jgi:hypothetical protein
MSTASRSALVKTIVDRLKAYADGSGNSINTLTTGRVYVNQAPDATAFPCVVLRMLSWQTQAQFNNTQATFDLEVMVMHRPRSKEQEAELIGDLVEEALLTWRESGASLGLSHANTSRRETIPPLPLPADRELVQHRLVISCTTWPRFLTTALV